ncbi:MAG TPA: hypothetical protein VFI23_17810 [Rhizomicrobium sp.]|nr:hypothetical protein [Rhizomicrobium sp.]
MIESGSNLGRLVPRKIVIASAAFVFCMVALLNQALAAEQAVIVHFRYGSRDLHRLFVLEDKLEATITRSQAGEFDGDEIATDGSDGFLYMYGPSADKLFEIVIPVLKTTDFMRGADVTRRYGPPGDRTPEVKTVIAPNSNP